MTIETTTAKQIANAEQQLASAHLALDLETIATLLHPDYVIIQPGGRVETKADTLASLQSETRQWESAVADELDVRVYGSAAVVVGRWRATGQNAGVTFDYAARFLSVWVEEDGCWQNVGYQSTEIS